MTFNVSVQTASPTRQTTLALVRTLKENDCDFEWYPTDEQQIHCVKEDLYVQCKKVHRGLNNDDSLNVSLLDVGAGDGRVLCEITSGQRYAIEKSPELVKAMDMSITLVGGEFMEQSLIDKKVDVVYSNPPYSIFEWWATKVIREANASLVYLVLPKRWVGSTQIRDALLSRQAKHAVIGHFNYENAHRRARAQVEVIRIELGAMSHDTRRAPKPDVDPFDLWFAEQFKLDLPKNKIDEYAFRQSAKDDCKQAVSAQNALVKREGVIRMLVSLYNQKMDQLFAAYGQLNSIDPVIFRELGVNIEGIKSAIRLKVSSLKDAYWGELIDSLDSVTSKLCTKTRERFKKRLKENTAVEFTEQNAVLITLWIIQHADAYYEQQFIDLYAKITNSASVRHYKSNQKTFGQEQWRYTQDHAHLGRYGLDYRIVLEDMGGLPDFTRYATTTGTDVMNDLLTVSTFLGFDVEGNIPAHHHNWTSGKSKCFYFFNHTTQEKEVLFEAKLFQKGTMHLRLHSLFIQKINVVHGRLMGWLRTAQEAAEELDVPIDVAESAFSTSLKIAASSTQILLPVYDHDAALIKALPN